MKKRIVFCLVAALASCSHFNDSREGSNEKTQSDYIPSLEKQYHCPDVSFLEGKYAIDYSSSSRCLPSLFSYFFITFPSDGLVVFEWNHDGEAGIFETTYTILCLNTIWSFYENCIVLGEEFDIGGLFKVKGGEDCDEGLGFVIKFREDVDVLRYDINVGVLNEENEIVAEQLVYCFRKCE